jgi:hypothetical protein
MREQIASRSVFPVTLEITSCNYRQLNDGDGRACNFHDIQNERGHIGCESAQKKRQQMYMTAKRGIIRKKKPHGKERTTKRHSHTSTVI